MLTLILLADLATRPEESARALLDEPGTAGALGALIGADPRSVRRWRSAKALPPQVACALRVLLALRLRADAAALAGLLRQEAETLERAAARSARPSAGTSRPDAE